MKKECVGRCPTTKKECTAKDPLGKNKPKCSGLCAESDRNIRVLKKARSVVMKESAAEMNIRRKPCMDRVDLLSRPPARRLRDLWDEKGGILPPDRRDKIKSALEEEYFLSPEQTEQYFQALGSAGLSGAAWGGVPCATTVARKEKSDREKELRQRQKWLINFSAQIAYQLCDYISKGEKELVVTNRLRSIADVVLERVAEILGEPKPTRATPTRLARFMVAVSDRIAVWIENVVYRADSLETIQSSQSFDQHMRLDNEKTIFD